MKLMAKLSAVLGHFEKVDPVLFSASRSVKLEKLKPREPDEYFSAICREIISQQLSGKVANVLFERFSVLFPNKKITPQKILKIQDEKIRNVGMAWSKVRAIKDLALKATDGTLNLGTIDSLTDEKVTEELIKVKGIGPWTTEMFLIFTLGREDVFSSKDLSLRKAIAKLYNSDKVEMISKKWAPYRTYACFILWASRDN